MPTVKRYASEVVPSVIQASGRERLVHDRPFGFTADYAAACGGPVVIEQQGRNDDRAQGPMIVTLRQEVPCRKCAGCLRSRRSLWLGRALVEQQRALRTWFGTMTLGTTQHWTMLTRARQKAFWSGYDLDADGPEAVFRGRCREVGKELTTYIKRVRKASGARIRYLIVFEAHKSGLPHIHMLLHEVTGSVSKRTLDSKWELGFTQFRLVDPAEGSKAAYYVAKYLGKDAHARLRASLLYGGTEGAGAQGATLNDVKFKDHLSV